MLFKIIISFLILSIELNQCIKVADFCFQIINNHNNELIRCEENIEYKYGCHRGFCSLDRFSCLDINSFSTLKAKQIDEKSFMFFHNQFKVFMGQVKDCPEPSNYKLDPDHVCLNRKNCYPPSFWSIFGGPSLLKKRYECKCRGTYSIRCSSDYCASDQRACNEIIKNNNSISGIKKC